MPFGWCPYCTVCLAVDWNGSIYCPRCGTVYCLAARWSAYERHGGM